VRSGLFRVAAALPVVAAGLHAPDGRAASKSVGSSTHFQGVPPRRRRKGFLFDRAVNLGSNALRKNRFGGREMPISFRCPHCQKKISAPDHAANANVNCPMCARPLTVPNIPAQPHRPQPLPSAPALQSMAFTSAGNPKAADKEPWFFDLISFFANFIIGAGLLVFAPGLCIFVYLFIALLADTRSFPDLALSVLGIFYLVLYPLFVVFSGAMILLVLDMARSFRFLRTIAKTIDEMQGRVNKSL